MATARNKYRVYPSDRAAEISEVYADQLLLSSAGDAVFQQVRKSALVNDGGARNLETDMTIVRIVAKGTFTDIVLIPAGTERPAYEESGSLELTH